MLSVHWGWSGEPSSFSLHVMLSSLAHIPSLAFRLKGGDHIWCFLGSPPFPDHMKAEMQALGSGEG